MSGMVEEENLRNGGWLTWEGGHTLTCQISRQLKSVLLLCKRFFSSVIRKTFIFLEMLILARSKACTMTSNKWYWRIGDNKCPGVLALDALTK